MKLSRAHVVLITIAAFTVFLFLPQRQTKPPQAVASAPVVQQQLTRIPSKLEMTVPVAATKVERIDAPEEIRRPDADDAAPPSVSSEGIPDYRFPSFEPPAHELQSFPLLHRQISDSSQRAFAVPEIPALVSSQSPSPPSSSPVAVFETTYVKIDCGALVANLCLRGGQPHYFRKDSTRLGRFGTKMFSSTGGTRVCNEAESKVRFHMVMQEPITIGGADGVSKKSHSSSVLPAPYQPNTLILAAMCWELYGYHLFLCLLNNYGVLSQLKFAPELGGAWRPRVKVVLLKTWSGDGAHSLPLGSAARSWNEENNRTTTSSSSTSTKKNKNTKNAFWGWWRVLVEKPSDVFVLDSFPATCAGYAVVAGKADPLTPALQQKFRSEMLRRFGLPSGGGNEEESAASSPGGGLVCPTREDAASITLRVTVVDRQSKFQLRNSADIANQFKAALENAARKLNMQRGEDVIEFKVISRVVIFETLPSLREQMEVAASTDVLIGMHGNGLTWSAFMHPSSDRGTALVELWPSHAFNANYAHIAGRANVRRWSVAAGISNCPKRCPASIPVPKETADEVAEFVVAGAEFRYKKICLRRTAVDDVYFSADRKHLKYQAEYALRKKNKKNKKDSA